MKIKKKELIFIILLLVSFFLRIYKIDSPGYVTDELLMIAGGIKYFFSSSYNPSLYDMCLPGAKIWMGLFNVLFSGKNFSEISSIGIRDYGSLTLNTDLLEGLEFFSRLPSAIIGIVAGIFMYLLVKKMYGIKSALFASSFFIFNSLIITFSRLALGESYQIAYMMISLYFIYSYLETGKIKDLILAAVFLGITISTKLNALLLIPFFILIIIKKSLDVNKRKIKIKKTLITSSIIFAISLFFSIMIMNGFDLGTVFEIAEYFNTENYNTLGVYFFSLMQHAFFYINPIIWVCLIISFYCIFKERSFFSNNDFFSFILILILLASSFFYTHYSMKRGVQFVLFVFIVSSRFLSEKNKVIFDSKILKYLAIILFFIDLGFLIYYHPNTAVYTNILCRTQECIENNALYYFDSRLVGESLNELPEGFLYDMQVNEGYIKYYMENKEYYLSQSILKWYFNIEKQDYYFLKENNFSYASTNSFNNVLNKNLYNELSLDSFGCKYYPIMIKDFEMSRIYDLSTC